MGRYNNEFYKSQMHASRISADETIKVLKKIIPMPESVVDLGCGVGSWLAAFLEQGTRVVRGFDGDYVDPSFLQIPQESFTAHDLSQPLPEQYIKEYDLAISVEVAEHLQHDDAAHFIKSLTRLSKTVLFSAAIPYQGGTGHVNEQWPEYWASFFLARNFYPVDKLRPLIWGNANIRAWYRQNLILFVHESLLDKIMPTYVRHPRPVLTRIHPEMYIWACVRNKAQALQVSAEDARLYRKIFADYRAGAPISRPSKTYCDEYPVDFDGKNT